VDIRPEHHIAGELVSDQSRTFLPERAGGPGEVLPPEFPEGGEAVVDRAARAAETAVAELRAMALTRRAELLEAIADELDGAVDAFAERMPQETGLPEARARGELARTTGQLRLFGSVVRQGDFLGARIDRGDPHRQPAAKPDIRQMRVPVGPVAVFGASNFPLAFSVAGGDTASALAAGCPVVVKAHPGHPGVSAIAAAAVDRAVARTSTPPGVFSMVQGKSNAVGAALVRHPAVKAVGFTGSFLGGTALARIAAERPEPIPVFAEMGSVNPLFLLPGALKARGDSFAEGLVGSMSLGVGQFCTQPGVVFAPSGDALEALLEQVGARVRDLPAGVMLHSGILNAYQRGISELDAIDGVEQVACGPSENNRAQPRVYRVTRQRLDEKPEILQEVFGPVAIVVECESVAMYSEAARGMPGQLTAGVHGDEGELVEHRSLIEALEARVGRVIFNGFPTGVEVCHAMIHGGPYPATTDARTTSVGTLAIERFLRPVCYQDCPEELLPEALRDGNPLGLSRLVDGRWEPAA